jgi:hypothetical protein
MGGAELRQIGKRHQWELAKIASPTYRQPVSRWREANARGVQTSWCTREPPTPFDKRLENRDSEMGQK